MSRFTSSVCALVVLPSIAAAQTFVPQVTASIHDAPPDGIGDTFNASPFEGLLRETATVEDRAIQEFAVPSLAGATIQSATLSGSIYVNNAFDNGPRAFDFSLYAGNGVADLSDFQIASTVVGSGSYHPPNQTSLNYSFDVTAALQSLVSGGATWVGLKVDCTTNPNFPNILDAGTTSSLDVVVGTCGTSTVYCTAGTTTNGCVPSISGTGTPDANAGAGFVIAVADVEGAKQGLFFYGLDNTGFVSLPWGTGASFLCIKSPTQRCPSQNSGGTVGQCDGAFSIDWNAFIAGNPSAYGNPFAAGQHVYAQAWFRDPPSPKTTNLSDALEIVVCP